MVYAVVLAEKQLLLHEALKTVMQRRSDMRLVRMIHEPAQLATSLRQDEPDLLLLSSNMLLPPPLECLCTLRQEFSQTKLLLLLEHGDEGCPCQWVEAGIAGCMVKTEPCPTFVEAMSAVLSGRPWYSQEVSHHLRHHQADALTVRERAVLQLIAEEKTDGQIAQLLNVSERTVRCHLTNLYKKLNSQTRVGAVVQAIKRGLLRL